MKRSGIGLVASCGWIGIFMAGADLVGAGEAESVSSPFSADLAFQSGNYEAMLNNGFMVSPFLARGGRPDLNYTVSEVQFGYMLSNVRGSGLLRGNFELPGSVFGGGIFEGEGNYVTGTTLWLRYNFVPVEKTRFVPYLAAGAGVSLADVNRHIEGQIFNFNLNLAAGVRYLFSDHWSIALEYRYQHISNADMSAHNLGINANGPILGVSYLF